MKKSTYRDFEATELYCPKCRRAVPVRKRLLLILPEGDKYDYSCVYCGTSVGDKTVRQKDNLRIITN
ncbi:MAG TPA: cytoplasmic protein [Syntrophales bacterium]|nr:cytoplasmic protein [Syntrophobacterales bacterium]HRT26841.1 cytoplasmic protein [Syntrophales bacterium]HRT70072.1 cytoplasmic protein [Syntrophales bacterium]